jgi:replicative DNA helicase
LILEITIKAPTFHMTLRVHLRQTEAFPMILHKAHNLRVTAKRKTSPTARERPINASLSRTAVMTRKRKTRGLRPLSVTLEGLAGAIAEGGHDEIATGLVELDQRNAALAPGHLIVIGSPPAGGKTNFALFIAANVAIRQGRAVGIFSLESTAETTASRILAAESQVSLTKMASGKLTQADYHALRETGRRIRSAPLFIDAVRHQTDISYVLRSAEKAWERGSLDLLIVDYLQLLHDYRQEYETRDEEVDSIVRSLKQLARALEIPVVVVSQALLDLRSEPPTADDLENGSPLGQHADLILLIHSPVAHSLPREPMKLAQIIVAKDRYGCKEILKAVYLPEYCTFRNALEASP